MVTKMYDFEITVGSDLDYEDLTAEIFYKNEFVARLQQEEGFKNMKIQLANRENSASWEFYLSEWLEVIERAKTRLWELRKDT